MKITSDKIYYVAFKYGERSKMAIRKLAIKIDKQIKEVLELFCNAHGLKINHFIEEAILDKLEEYEDLHEIKKLRNEAFRPLNLVLNDLKASGKI